MTRSSRRSQALSREAAASAGRDATVGIGAPGSASPRTGLWRNANILVLQRQAARRAISSARIGRPVRLENDANCFALVGSP